MLQVTDKERKLVREKMFYILTEYLTKQGKPVQHSRVQDLSYKFEQQVYQTAATRVDYVNAIREKMKQVYKRIHEESTIPLDEQQNIFIHPDIPNMPIQGQSNNSPTQIIIQDQDTPPLYRVSSLLQKEYQLLSQQVSFLGQFLPHSNKIFSTYQSLGGSLSMDTSKKLNILRTVLEKQIQEFPSGLYLVHPSRFGKLIDYLKKYTSLLSQKIGKMETNATILDFSQFANNESYPLSPTLTITEQEEVDFIMNVTIFGGTTKRPSVLSNINSTDQASAICSYISQQFDLARQSNLIDDKKYMSDSENSPTLSIPIPRKVLNDKNQSHKDSITSRMNSVKKLIQIHNLENNLLHQHSSSDMSAWIREMCNLLRLDCYITELYDENKVVLLMSHKNSNTIAKVYLPDIDSYIKKGHRAASWHALDSSGNDISITDIARNLFSI